MQKKRLILAVAAACALAAQANAEPSVALSGELAVNLDYSKAYDDQEISDIYVDTFLLNLEHEVNPHVGLKAALLHEEEPLADNGDIGVDEAFITLKPGPEALELVVGRQYVPFGLHDSAW